MEDIFEFLFKGVFRFIWHVIVELIFEIAIKGPGYFIAKLFTKKTDIDVDSWVVGVFGILFWIVIGSLIIYFAIDSGEQDNSLAAP